MRECTQREITSGALTREGYLHDGWNVAMISNLNLADGAHLARKWSCVWRPDVGSRLYARSSWQKAGGVGGLAWMQTGIAQTVAMYTYQSVTGNAEVHIPMMDHMGNVRHYYQIKSTGPGAAAATVTGQVTANLDYDAFGREVRATGPKTSASGQPPGLAANDPWVDVLPFHFSTKLTDRESGLNYYRYRFYDSVDGRWLNRDPIEERGGSNLFCFMRNHPTNNFDVLGLDAWDQITQAWMDDKISSDELELLTTAYPPEYPDFPLDDNGDVIFPFQPSPEPGSGFPDPDPPIDTYVCTYQCTQLMTLIKFDECIYGDCELVSKDKRCSEKPPKDAANPTSANPSGDSRKCPSSATFTITYSGHIEPPAQFK